MTRPITILALLKTIVHSLSQPEDRLGSRFCRTKDPPAIFHSSITSLADLYELLLPEKDEIALNDVDSSTS